ncbi:MAG: peptidoglycan-binding domain-containing protein [Phycisphaerae bacterium]|nr:peptidoglycan-binding domain-containing protein [Phycisphaerae bacterium]
MARNHRCSGTDHITKLASEAGFREPNTVWNHARNRQLRGRRASPNLLFKGDSTTRGDTLHIPDPERRAEPGATGTHVPLVADTSRIKLRLRILKQDFTPVANAPFEIRSAGQIRPPGGVPGIPPPITGRTTADGKIEVDLMGRTTRATLTVRVPASDTDDPPLPPGPAAPGGRRPAPAVRGDVPITWTLHIGKLNPIMERAPDQNCTSGVQQRLNNLALYTGSEDGRLGRDTRNAITAFQQIFQINPANGTPDQAQTQRQLQQVHDSVAGLRPPGAAAPRAGGGGGGAAAPGAAPAAPGGAAPAAPGARRGAPSDDANAGVAPESAVPAGGEGADDEPDDNGFLDM